MMTLRKRIEALLKDVPNLTTYDFDRTVTVDTISLSLDNQTGAVARIEEEINIKFNPGNSMAIDLVAVLDLNDDGRTIQKKGRMILIPAATVKRYEALLHELRHAMTLRALLEDELGEERASGICAAVDRDEAKDVPRVKVNAREIGKLIADSITRALGN